MGSGGTIFPGPRYLSHGMMDGELAYLLGGFSKKTLFQGGAAFTSSDTPPESEEFAVVIDGRYSLGWSEFMECVLKAVAALQAVMGAKPYEVILTGRLSRIPGLFSDVSLLRGGWGSGAEGL